MSGAPVRAHLRQGSPPPPERFRTTRIRPSSEPHPHRFNSADLPKSADACFNLANALADAGRPDAAIACYQRAVELRPQFAEAALNLGVTLLEAGRRPEAIDAYRYVIAIRPNWPLAHYNLGGAHFQAGDFDAAAACFERAIQLSPSYAHAHNTLGVIQRFRGQFEAAQSSFERAIAHAPKLADAHYNLAGTLMLQGDYLRGFREYEWRWNTAEFASSRRNFTQPQWHGEDLNGRTILLHTEQGFGDAIQFVRFAPLVAQRGGRVIIECQRELVRLFQSLPNIEIRPRGSQLPSFDLHCPFMSLPLALGTTLQTIPKPPTALGADEAITTAWQKRIAGDECSLKVGITWSGNPANSYNPDKSMPFERIEPLLDIEGINFYSLQKGGAPSAANLSPMARWIDWTSDLRDFADTAALISSLDLIISADTAVAHLAGSLGKPVWTFHPHAAEWRWLRDRTDSPWYPSMRLFRQAKAGDWASVVDDLSRRLTAVAFARRTADENVRGSAFAQNHR